MTKIKICGLSRLEDIDYVNELSPDYIGFVFAKSKRQVSEEQAIKLKKSLDPNIKTVGVFVNESLDRVQRIAEGLALDVVQFHGNENKQYIEHFSNYKVWKSVGIKLGIDTVEFKEVKRQNQQTLDELMEYQIDGILLDTIANGNSGGTGQAFDWEILQELKISKPLILAGGLNAENVNQAIQKGKPDIVDVSGGVEVNGVKNFEKIKEFIDKVRKRI